MEQFIAYISATIIFIAGSIYTVRVYKREIEPNIVTWLLFSIIGIAIVLSYSASGAKENLIPAIAATINPILIVILSLFIKNKRDFTKIDIICGIIGLFSIALWILTKNNKELSQWVLYLAIISDIIAIIPTIKFVRENPDKDRPMSWMIFAFGYAIAFFTITDHTFANYSLPLCMVFSPALVWWPLVKYRIKNNIPLKKWI